MDGIGVGSELQLRHRERRTKARVVGIVEEIGAPTVYANDATFEAVTGLGDAHSLLRVKTATGALESVTAALDQALLEARLPATHIYTRDELRTSLEEHFATVTDVMRIIALAAALLGAISLAASVGLNVVERAREIGVVRALGATARSVNAMFLIESGAVVILSAVISFVLAVVFTRAPQPDGVGATPARRSSVTNFLKRTGAAGRRLCPRHDRGLALPATDAAHPGPGRPRLRINRRSKFFCNR